MMLAFNKWDTEGIKIEDKGIIDYVNLKPTLVPKTGARYAGKRFHKSKVFIVERLINKVMVAGHKGKKHFKTSGHITGKAQNAYRIVKTTFEIIEQKTKENPIKVLVKAIENAAPREEIISIEYGGARYPKAVECAPQRRIDVALKNLVQGSYHKAFNAKIKAESALADEIIAAYSLNPKSNALSKKNDLERQADASR
uniref:30S ribosomal protein S7 n=1 Tax=uncultured marine group II/III euryarchaeote KM3_139_C07 TaxID=1457870 RepID=A0A075GGN0_9EURY|nr:ribosomal protein S7P (RP-S7, rpsG) [uncultured marine group II/III euryarchaeote KM3_139_C07]